MPSYGLLPSSSLPLFPFLFLFLPFLFSDFFATATNFGTVEEVPSHTITQYPVPPHPPPTYAPQFRWHSDPTQTVDWRRHWRRAPVLRRRHAPPRRRGNGPTAYLREGVRAQVLRRRMEVWSGFLWRLWQLMEGWRLVCDCFLWRVPSKNQIGSECRVSVRVHSVLGCMGSCGNTLWKQLFFNNEIWLQWRRNSDLIMALISVNRCSSLRTMLILDDDVVRMFPCDLIGWDNRGTKGVRLVQLVLGETVSE